MKGLGVGVAQWIPGFLARKDKKSIQFTLCVRDDFLDCAAQITVSQMSGG